MKIQGFLDESKTYVKIKGNSFAPLYEEGKSLSGYLQIYLNMNGSEIVTTQRGIVILQINDIVGSGRIYKWLFYKVLVIRAQ